MIDQINIYGKTKLEVSIERLKAFEPEQGYFLAYSGGKDSTVIKALAEMARVKFTAHYQVTSCDPPELVQFVKQQKDVVMDIPRYKDGVAVTMWNLIPKRKMPPTRIIRYCCQFLKEQSGIGEFVVTGVRQEESIRRKRTRAGLEIGQTKTGRRELLDPDNNRQEYMEICRTKAQKVLNPIIDWTTEEVWEFINRFDIPYCSLYDEGYTRLGCIGCPMSYNKKSELERWPKIRESYIRAFERMIENRIKSGMETEWETGEDVMEWWLGD